MYKVIINQPKEIELTNGETYKTSNEVELNVKSVETIETIVGLFADTCEVKISKIKEDN